MKVPSGLDTPIEQLLSRPGASCDHLGSKGIVAIQYGLFPQGPPAPHNCPERFWRGGRDPDRLWHEGPAAREGRWSGQKRKFFPEMKAGWGSRSKNCALRSVVLRKPRERYEVQQCGSCTEARRLTRYGRSGPITSFGPMHHRPLAPPAPPKPPPPGNTNHRG